MRPNTCSCWPCSAVVNIDDTESSNLCGDDGGGEVSGDDSGDSSACIWTDGCVDDTGDPCGDDGGGEVSGDASDGDDVEDGCAGSNGKGNNDDAECAGNDVCDCNCGDTWQCDCDAGCDAILGPSCCSRSAKDTCFCFCFC